MNFKFVLFAICLITKSIASDELEWMRNRDRKPYEYDLPRMKFSPMPNETEILLWLDLSENLPDLSKLHHLKKVKISIRKGVDTESTRK